MSGDAIDIGFVTLNLLLTLVAVWVNVGEAVNGFGPWRLIRAWTAVFGGVYATSYVILLTGVVDRLAWSHVMIGVSPVVWVAIWIAPAWQSRQIRQRIVAEGIADIGAARKTA